jgi:hypothetical protein
MVIEIGSELLVVEFSRRLSSGVVKTVVIIKSVVAAAMVRAEIREGFRE